MTLIKQDFSKEEILQSGIYYAIGGVLASCIALVSSLYVVHSLSLYEYGVFRLILSLTGLFDVLQFSGLNDVARNDVAIALKSQDEKSAAKIFFEFVWLKFVLMLFAWGAFFAFVSFFLGNFYDKNLAEILQLASLFILFQALNDVLVMFLGAVGALKTISKTTPFFEAINLFFTVGVFMIFLPSVHSIVLASVLMQTVTLSIYCMLVQKDVRRLWSFYRFERPTTIIYIIKTYGKWSVFSNLLGDFLSNARNYIIKFLLSTEAVAVYSIAASFYLYLSLLFPVQKVLANFLPYKITDHDIKKDYFTLGVRYSTFIYICLMLVGVVGVTGLIWFVIPKYAASLPIFYAMLFSLPMLGIQYFSQIYLYTLRQQRIIFMRMLLKNISAVVLLFTLVPLFGQIALGIENVLTNILLTTLVYVMLVRMHPELKLELSSFVVRKSDVIFLKILIFKAFKFHSPKSTPS